MRQSRKQEHLEYAAKLNDGPASNCFKDFSLVHNCLPGINSTQLDISSKLAGLHLYHPIIINAITGGAASVTEVNRSLAEVAKATDTPMAVGSQYAGLENPETCCSYKVVRKVNPSGIVFANLGAHVTADQACAAVEMIDAQALQIHLNPAQEIIMAEGERDFSGYLSNVEKIASKVKVPVIVKEVGCGIAFEQARLIAQTGIKAIDIGGAGGTNFIAIEAARLKLPLAEDLIGWGLPTAISAVEVGSQLPEGVDLIVSGGVRTPLEAVKSIALGAAGIGIASPLLKIIYEQGIEAAIQWIHDFTSTMKTFMLLTGSVNLQQLRNAPIVITGYSRDWLSTRGFDINRYAARSMHG